MSRCKQVSRLGFILLRPSPPHGGAGYTGRLQAIALVSRVSPDLHLAHLPAFAVVSYGNVPTRFRQLHGYWDSSELSSDSYDSAPGEPNRASLRRYTGYSFVTVYYNRQYTVRQFVFRGSGKRKRIEPRYARCIDDLAVSAYNTNGVSPKPFQNRSTKVCLRSCLWKMTPSCGAD